MEISKYKFVLDDHTKNYAKECLNEDESKYNRCIEEIQKWLKTQPQLHAKADVVNIVRFLRCGKFDLDRTKNRINEFYTLKGSTPEWYANRDPTLPQLQHLLDLGVFVPLLKKDPNGRLVVIIRAAIHDAKKNEQNDIFKISTMILELAVERDESISVYGIMAIIDLRGIGFGHVRQLTPGIIRKAVHSWQSCYPLRPKGFDFINAPSYINVVLNIFRQFMTTKLKKRVHVHGSDFSALYKTIPQDVLPEEYGGTNGKIQDLIDYWKTEVTNARDWFIEDEKYKAEL
ncbi:retinol-binding protein pinta-like isoform X1 [Lycorma delicatula]|uniref:retinol-binding protein pinta-like isoform X1 n=1 Tax=Lycorma delicatula TaxID=130591 RepID=UPI003F50DC92